MKKTKIAASLAFALSASPVTVLAADPDTLTVINHSNTPVYVSTCSEKPDQLKVFCSGWVELKTDMQSTKIGYRGQKLYALVYQGGAPMTWTFNGGDGEEKEFTITTKDPFRILHTGYNDMRKLQWKKNFWGWVNDQNMMLGRSYPDGWKKQTYVRSATGRTQLRITP